MKKESVVHNVSEGVTDPLDEGVNFEEGLCFQRLKPDSLK